MKKFFAIISFQILLLTIQAQIDISAGMGLNFLTSPSFKDYINANFAPVNDQLQSFKSSVEFVGEGAYSISNNFQIGIEYGLQLDSYSTSSGRAGFYEAKYTQHKPSVIAYYVVPGEGYKFKFGGGVGLRLLQMEEQLANSPTPIDYSATGFGFLFKAQGHTLLSGNFYATVGADLRYDMPGEPESSSGNKIIDASVNDSVNLNMFSVGVKLGVSYFF